MKYSLDSYFALSSLASIAIIAAMIALLIFGITMLLLYLRLRKQSTQTLQASGEQFHTLDHNPQEMVDSISADMSAERLRLSTELAGVAVWEFDSAESRLSRTPNHDALYGLEQNNDWRIDRFLEATHPDDRERYQQIIHEAVLPNGPDNYSFDFRVVWPDESIHWLANTGEVSKRDEDGVGVLIRGCLIDITERKQAEDALLESEKRYRLIYDNSLDAILLTAPDGRVLSANAAATEMFQMTEEEICQAGRRGLVDSEDTRLNGFIEERASTKQVFGELNLLRKDGTKFPAEVSSAIFTNRYGEERTSMIIRDVSERKGAEERLIASEKRFRALFEQSGDYCLILDPNTVDGIPIIVDASQTAWAMHGYAREEFIGRPVADIDDYEGKQLVVERTKRIMTGNPFFIETTHVRKDGSTFPVSVHANRIDIEGEPPLIFTTEFDITKRKLAEESLGKSEERLRLATEMAGVAVWETDLQTRQTTRSANHDQLYGLEPQDVWNFETFLSYVHPDDREQTIRNIRQSLEPDAPNPSTFDLRVVWPDESVHWLSVRGEVIARDENGYGTKVRGCTIDFTKRREAEEALILSEERLRLSTEIGGVAVWESDIATGEITRSSNHDQLYGLEPQETWNLETLLSCIHPDDREDILRNIQESAKPGSPDQGSYDFRVVWPDGSLHWLAIRGEVSERDEYGVGTLIRGCVLDITERKQAEEALQSSEARLIDAQRIAEMGDFVWDFKTGKITWSDALYELLKYDKSEEINYAKVNQDIFHPDDRKRVSQWLNGSIASGEPELTPTEYRIIRKDGAVRHVRVQGVIRRDEENAIKIFATVQDITERVEAEKALRESEERLRLSTEIAGVAVWEYDFEEDQMNRSDNHDQLYGMEYQDVWRIDTFLNVAHPDDREISNRIIQEAIKPGGIDQYNFDFRIIQPDGSIRCLEVKGEVTQRDEDGNGVIVRGCLIDISERKQMEEALRESEERLRLSTELGGVAVWEYHFAEDRMIRTDNHDRLYGVEPQDSWGFEDFLAHIHPDDQERASQVIQEAVGPGGSGFSSFDYRVIWPDGTLHWLALIGEVTERDENGVGAVVRGCLIDITQRKLAEDALRLSEASLREAQEIALLGNWEMDLTIMRLTWSEVNNRIFGVDANEDGLTFEDFMALIHPDDLEAAYGFLDGLKTQGSGEFEYRVVRPDGEIRWVATEGKAIYDEEGNPVRVFGIAQDITERMLSEEALRLSEASLREAQEIANLGNWELDVATTRITWSNVNDRIFGIELPADGITFNTFINLIHPEDQESIYQFRDALATDGSVHVEYRAVRPDGEIRWIAAEGKTTLDESGSPVRMYGVLQDITERKLADEALRTSEEKFRGLYEQSPVAIQIYDETGALIDANQQTLELFGVDDISNLLGYDMWSSPNYTPETIDAVRSGQSVYIEATLDFESVKETNLFPTDKTGILHLDLHVFPLMREEHITGYIVELVDITARIEAAAAIAQSEERFRGLYEQSPIAVQIYNKEGLLVDVNQQTLELFGINSVNYILGFNMWTDPNLTPDAIETLKNGKPVALAGMLDFDIVKAAELFPTTKSGIMHVDMHVTPLTLNDEIAGYLVQMVDETERQKAAEAIALSEEKFRSLFEQSQVAIQLYDTDGKLVDLNQRTEEIFGIESKEELFGFDMWAALNIAPEAIANLRGGQSANIEYIFDYDMVKDAGLYPTDRSGILYLDIYLSPIMRNNDITNYLVQVIDITERKQMEERLLQAQKMESIGRLAGGIAHDFNNILVPIMGYVDLGIRIMDPAEDFFPYLQRIRQAADRAAGLTRQILAFSRQQVLEMQVLDLNQVVTNFETFIKRLIGEDVVLQTFLDPELYQVNADSGQIEQVLMNLAINARDAMPSGGNLTIETANVYLGADYVTKYAGSQPPGHYVMVAISDTGHGMDEETQQQIFDPFFTTKSQGEGTGLGLSTVFGIIKQHGGNVWVYSELEKGATFKIYLPRIEGETLLSDDNLRLSNPVGGMETVLVVEDEEMVRQLVCETLAAYGYHVLEAQSPSDALRIVGERSDVIHLLLTDVIMPEMNGKELYQKIAAIDPHIKVLYMSGYTDNVIVHHGMLDKGVNFLQKPFTIQDLTEKIKQVLNADKA